MSDIPTEVNPASSEPPDSRDRRVSDGRAADIGGVEEIASVPNGPVRGTHDLAASVNGSGDAANAPSGPLTADAEPLGTPPAPPRRRPRRQTVPQGPEDIQADGEAVGAVANQQPEMTEPAVRRPRRPRKKPDVVPDGQPLDEPAPALAPAFPPEAEMPIPETRHDETSAISAAPNGTVDSPDASASGTLDVPYTPPEAYQPAPDPFANLGSVGGTLTADAPVIAAEVPPIAAEPAPITVDLTPPPSPPAPPESSELAGQPAPPPSDDDEFDDEGGTMTIIEHLEELRKRLMWCLGAIAVGSFIGWFFAHPLVDLAKAPLIGKADVITLTVFGAFVLQIKMALAVGICLSMPMTLYQIWGFVAPGLTRREKRYARPFVLLGSFLFVFGAAVGYFVFPKGVAFALTFNQSLSIKPTIEANGYVGFIAMIMVLFGIAFELPVFMVFLSLIGLFSSQAMLSRWRAAIVIIWAGAMVVTPGADIISPVILATILTVLYFLGIWLTKLVGR